MTDQLLRASTAERETLFELQQRALEASGWGLWAWDIGTDQLAWNPACDAFTAAGPDGPPTSFARFLAQVHPDDRGPLQAALAAALDSGLAFEQSFRVVDRDGNIRRLILHGMAVHQPDGPPARMLGALRDVSREEAALQHHREAQEQLSLAVESSGLGIWTWDIATGQVEWTEQCYRIHGLARGQFAGTLDAFTALVHPADREHVLASVQRAIAARAIYVSEFRIIKPGGEVAWVSNRGRARYAADGTAVSVVGTIGDVTPLKQTATALHAALNASRTGTFSWNIQTDALTWDVELDRLFDVAPGEAVQSLSQFIARVHADDRAAVVAACQRCRSEGADFDLEYRVVVPDGSIRWLYGRGVTFRDSAGRPSSMTGACVDITARVASERALALNRSRLEYATRLSGVGFWYCNLPFDVLVWDERVKEHFFFPPTAQITIDDFYGRIHEEDREPTRKAIALSVSSRAPYDIVYRTVHPATGAVKWIRALGGTDYAADGTPTFFDGVTVDVSAQKLDEQRLSMLNEQLRSQDRLKDEFIAMLSHELRNPLAPIRAAAKVIASPDLTAAQLKRAQAIIERQVRNMSLLLDDLLDIARITQGKLSIKKRVAALVDVVDAAVEAVRPALTAKSHQLALRLPAEPVLIDADALRLSQILSNLLTNAGKYSEPGSHIEVAATAQGGMLTLSVKDDGVGIAPKSITTIFEMFSQIEGATGMSDGGLGIGLALVKGLAELHGGTVQARSGGLGLGSEFIVRIPLGMPAAAASCEQDAPAVPSSVRRKVLIADDNEDAAQSVSLLLELAGYEVRTTHLGRDALSLAQLFRPHVALLDIGMPDISGYDVARHLRQEAWAEGLKLIALTGWGQDEDRRRAFEAGFNHHLRKPVDPDQLLATIRSEAASAT